MHLSGPLPSVSSFSRSTTLSSSKLIVIAPPGEKEVSGDEAEALLKEALQAMSVKDAASQVAKLTGLPRQELYTLALKVKAGP